MNPPNQKAQELFAEIGRMLKAAREEKGIGLGELSANIRINQGYLQSIEAGELGRLPALTFVRGFLRNYAVAVGLNEAEIIEQFKHVVIAADQGPTPLEPPAEVSPQPMVTFSPMKALLVLAIMGMIGWAVYLIVQVATAPDTEVSTTEDAAPAQSEEASGSPFTKPPAASSEARTPGATPPASPQAPQAQLPQEPPSNLQLTLKGLERSWVRLSVDRREPVDVLIEPAETGEWEANEEFRLTIGKSHGVAVYLNGEEIILPRERNMLIPELVLNKLTLLKLEN